VGWDFELGVWEFRVLGLRFGVWGVGLRAGGKRLERLQPHLGVQGLRVGVPGVGFRVRGLGCMVSSVAFGGVSVRVSVGVSVSVSVSVSVRVSVHRSVNVSVSARV